MNFMGCPCHIAHNTADTASQFMDVNGFDMEEIAIDLFYWFDKSSKHKLFSEVQKQGRFCVHGMLTDPGEEP